MRLLTFDSTHHALLAEQLALGVGFAAAVIPTPPGTGALCDLAIEYLPDEEESLCVLLRSENVAFRLWSNEDASSG